jgi:hypothetical protein
MTSLAKVSALNRRLYKKNPFRHRFQLPVISRRAVRGLDVSMSHISASLDCNVAIDFLLVKNCLVLIIHCVSCMQKHGPASFPAFPTCSVSCYNV